MLKEIVVEQLGTVEEVLFGETLSDAKEPHVHFWRTYECRTWRNKVRNVPGYYQVL